MFYLKLAYQNIKKSYQAYFPFFLASITMFVLLTTINLLWLTPDIQAKQTTPIILKLAFWVIAVFSLIIIQYSHKFLLNQRTKEFGLYSVLGMNRKKIMVIATLELAFVFLLIIFLGGILSSVVSRFLYLIMVHLIELTNFELIIVPEAYRLPSMLFTGIFIFLVLLTWVKLYRLSSLDLLKKAKKEEKETKGRLVFGLLGIALIVGAYLFSLKDSPELTQEYIFNSFLAILAVIVGTYLLFVSFLSWLLQKQKENRLYFYQEKHFITVSNMLHRIRQNALGLANITVLSSMVMTTLIATASIYVGTNRLAERMFPQNANTYIQYFSVRDREVAKELSNELFDELGVQDTQFKKILYLSFVGILENEKTVSLKDLLEKGGYKTQITVISLSDYQKLVDKDFQLKEDEVAYYHSTDKEDSQLEEIQLLNQKKFRVKQLSKNPKLPIQSHYFGSETALLVLPSEEQLTVQMEQLPRESSLEGEGTKFGYFHYSLQGNLTDNQQELLSALHGKIDRERPMFFYDTREQFIENNIEFTGPFLFIGVLIGFVFLMGACLIMYYKQISEGQEDKKAYLVLQEIGMSTKMIKKTINGQVLLVFFAPLFVAVIHVSFSIPLMLRFVKAIGGINPSLILTVAAETICIFVLLYYGVYRITSRVYYKMIER